MATITFFARRKGKRETTLPYGTPLALTGENKLFMHFAGMLALTELAPRRLDQNQEKTEITLYITEEARLFSYLLAVRYSGTFEEIFPLVELQGAVLDRRLNASANGINEKELRAKMLFKLRSNLQKIEEKKSLNTTKIIGKVDKILKVLDGQTTKDMANTISTMFGVPSMEGIHQSASVAKPG
ncbi:MAG TPA: hypothetical protein VJB70_03050 [Candidatus Paceibacterota bacterium]